MADTKGKKREIKAEIAGIIFAALALLSAVSLVFYHTGSSHRLGILGNNISWILFVTIGYSAYVFPFLFFLLAYEFIVRYGVNFRIVMPLSLFFFVSSLSAIFSLVTGSREDSAVHDPLFLRPGGILGKVVDYYTEFAIGTAGSYIVLFSILLISLRLGTGLSLIEIGKRVFSAALSVANLFYAGVSFLVRKFSEKKEELREKGLKQKTPEEKKVSEERPRIKPTIVTHPPKLKKQKLSEPYQEQFEFSGSDTSYQLPPFTLLDPVPAKEGVLDKEALLQNSRILEKKLKDFDVEGNVVEVRAGPVVTMYEFEPAPGVKVGKITNLEDDLALAMRAVSIRILAPIPGKAVVGIEIPNEKKEKIFLREILECPAFQKSQSLLSLALGKDISGMPFIADLARMPHLLVAGATGAGKSVSVNAMVLSILFKSTPDDVRFLMIDPKMLELTAYEGIPHLLAPVVTDAKRATVMLKGIVSEMERRYRLISEKGAKDIVRYNEMLSERHLDEKESEHKKLPYIVVVIDELADLMMASGKEVEESLVRLSQMSRAAGINLIVATQRPSVDVITGLIKTNFPARISFQVPSRTDSRTILDSNGAETLLGEGDMLFLPPGRTRLKRVHGAFVSEKETKRIIDFIKKQGKPIYEKEIITEKTSGGMEEDEELGEEFLERYKEAVKMASTLEMISTSYVQRRFRIGYNTAARIIEKMEKEGIVGPAQGSRPREVLRRTVEE